MPASEVSDSGLSRGRMLRSIDWARFVFGDPLESGWHRRAAWIFWGQFLWFIAGEPARAGLPSGLMSFLPWTLIAVELATVLLGVWCCRLSSGAGRWAADELFVRVLPRATVYAAALAWMAFAFLDVVAARWLEGGGVKTLSSEALHYWFVRDRAAAAYFLAFVVVYGALRLLLIRAGSRAIGRLSGPKPLEPMDIRRSTSGWMVAAVALAVPLYLPGNEAAADSVGMPLFFGLFLLLEGLAARVVLSRSSGAYSKRQTPSEYSKTWLVASLCVYLAGLLAWLLGQKLGWEGSWQLAPAVITRSAAPAYVLGLAALVNVVTYWLARVLLSRWLMDRTARRSARNFLPNPVLPSA